MTMTARCPGCGTTFRVTVEQLRVHAGTVRCGRCAEVFNALDNLGTTQTALPPGSTIRPEPARPPPATAERTEALSEPAGSASIVPPAVSEPAPAPPLRHAVGAEDLRPAEFGSPLAAHEEEKTRGGMWALGVAVLCIALFAQLIYFFRTEIAALTPASRYYLERVCGYFGCQVGLPKRANLIGIASSDLHAERDDLLVLDAVLRNRAPFAQAFPWLELTLTGSGEQPLARRVFRPAEYLAPSVNRPAGLPADQELGIRLALEVGDLKPSGYQLYVFYP